MGQVDRLQAGAVVQVDDLAGLGRAAWQACPATPLSRTAAGRARRPVTTSSGSPSPVRPTV